MWLYLIHSKINKIYCKMLKVNWKISRWKAVKRSMAHVYRSTSGMWSAKACFRSRKCIAFSWPKWTIQKEIMKTNKSNNLIDSKKHVDFAVSIERSISQKCNWDPWLRLSWKRFWGNRPTYLSWCWAKINLGTMEWNSWHNILKMIQDIPFKNQKSCIWMFHKIVLDLMEQESYSNHYKTTLI